MVLRLPTSKSLEWNQLWCHRFGIHPRHAFLLRLPKSTSSEMGCPGRQEGAWPEKVHYVSPGYAHTIQRILDEKGAVRLWPAGDYRNAGELRLKSNQSIYGLFNTRISKITISAGAENVLLSGLAPEQINFETTSKANPIRANCFERISTMYLKGPLEITNTFLDRNIFLGLEPGNIRIDTRWFGALTNNLFVRTQIHSAWPALTILGDTQRQSTNNAFVWLNILHPLGDSVYVANQKHLAFIGVDGESWNSQRLASNKAMFTARNVDFLRLYTMQGGDFFGASNPGSLLDLDATNTVVANVFATGPLSRPSIVFHPGAHRIALLGAGSLPVSWQSNLATYLRAGYSGADIDSNGINYASSAATIPASSIDWMTPQPSDTIEWPSRVMRGVDDPAGPGFRTGLLARTDATEFIQSQINERGIITLPAGLYYISRPLVLKRGQGIVGAGAGKTAIIAKSPYIDVIVAGDKLARKETTNFLLADITIQGGRNGISTVGQSAGPGAQFSGTVLSHVTIRDFAGAGLLLDGIYGWDNNLFDEVIFSNCRAGIQQIPSASYLSGEISGDVEGMSYFDKNVCYKCQFIGNGTAVELKAKRMNNLNAFIDSSFRANYVAAAVLRVSVSTLFLNTTFDNNGGNPSIFSDYPVTIINSAFRAGNSTVAHFGKLTHCEACTFTNDILVSGTVAAADSANVLLTNSSTAAPVSLGQPSSLTMMNSYLYGAALTTQRAAIFDPAGGKVVSSGTSQPISFIRSTR